MSPGDGEPGQPVGGLVLHTDVASSRLQERGLELLAAQCMDQSGEGIDPPYGALSDLVRKVHDTRLTVYAVAETLRSWRI